MIEHCQPLKIYLLTNNDPEGDVYDGYDECVVVASCEAAAREINPAGEWCSLAFRQWAKSPDLVHARYLGHADPTLTMGVILIITGRE